MLVIAPYEKMNGPNANLAGAKTRKNACNFLTLRKSEWLDRINCSPNKNKISGIANRNNRQFSMTFSASNHKWLSTLLCFPIFLQIGFRAALVRKASPYQNG